MNNNNKKVSKFSKIKPTLPFNFDNITKDEGKTIAFIWLLPCAIIWPLHRYPPSFERRSGIVDSLPDLEPYFVLWLFWGWIIPALYFKWKHRNEKKTEETQNITTKKFHKTRLFFWSVIILTLIPFFSKCRDMLFIYGLGQNDVSLVHDMIRCGANVNTIYEGRITPLMGAIQNGNKEMVLLLLNADADVSIKGSNGKNALDLAKEINNHEIINLLLKETNKK